MLGFLRSWFGASIGYHLFLMKAMSPPEISLKDIHASIVPFAILLILTLVLIMVFPQIALWLPAQFQIK